MAILFNPIQECVSQNKLTDSSKSTTDNSGPTIQKTPAYLIRQSLTPSTLQTIQNRIKSIADSDEEINEILPGSHIQTATVFLDRSSEDEPTLVWYIEVKQPHNWRDPITTLIERSPLFSSNSSEFGITNSECYGDNERFMSVFNPSRPSSSSNDVVLLEMDIQPGFGSWLARLIGWIFGVISGTGIEEGFLESSGEIIKEEKMWTESLFLVNEDGRYTLWWYMEADDMTQVMDAYESTDNRIGRWSEKIFGKIFGKPLSMLSEPTEASNFETLVHLTGEDRNEYPEWGDEGD